MFFEFRAKNVEQENDKGSDIIYQMCLSRLEIMYRAVWKGLLNEKG